MKSKLVIGVSFLVLTGFACFPDNDKSLADSRTIPVTGGVNPAAVKCINDGYILKAIEEYGVSKGYLCVNQETGMKCEIWSYFKGECDLSP